MEKSLEDETGLLDTPHLRRIREEGRKEGREEGRKEGILAVSRRIIVEAVTLRFAPPPEVPQQVRQSLEVHREEAALTQLLRAAIRSASLAEFQEALEQAKNRNFKSTFQAQPALEPTVSVRAGNAYHGVGILDGIHTAETAAQTLLEYPIATPTP